MERHAVLHVQPHAPLRLCCSQGTATGVICQLIRNNYETHQVPHSGALIPESCADMLTSAGQSPEPIKIPEQTHHRATKLPQAPALVAMQACVPWPLQSPLQRWCHNCNEGEATTNA